MHFPMEQFKVFHINGLDVLCVWKGKAYSDSGYVAVGIV